MSDLSRYTIEELKAEIARREHDQWLRNQEQSRQYQRMVRKINKEPEPHSR